MARLKARKGLLILFALVLVLSLAIMALPMAGTVGASPDEWYVDGALGTDGGAPQGTGPGALAFKTIQYAINDSRVTVGDTINVAAGTYDEDITIGKANLTLQSETVLGAIIQPTANCTAVIYISADGVTVDGFEIDGTTVAKNGILGWDTSGLTIKNNKIHGAVKAWDGCGILLFSWGNSGTVYDNLIEGNEVYDTGRMGIMVMDYGGGKYTVTSGNTITGNTVYDVWKKATAWSDHGGGIQINVGKDCSITNNVIYNVQDGQMGIYMYGSAAGNTISWNTIRDNPIGIQLWISGEGGSPPINWGGETATSPHVHYNNIYGNGDGAISSNIAGTPMVMDATYNWWGDASGPSGVGPGSGDAVSANVDYTPWLGAELTEICCKTINGSGTMQDTPTGGDITIDATGNHTITAAKYANNPGGPCPFTNEGSYYDVHLDDATNVTSLTIQFCPAHENEAIYYWDGSSYVACSDQVYSNGCIVVTITDETQPSLSDLTGLPFGQGFPVPVGGEAYPVNKISVLAPWIAVAVLLAGGISWFTLRRRRAQSQT